MKLYNLSKAPHSPKWKIQDETIPSDSKDAVFYFADSFL